MTISLLLLKILKKKTELALTVAQKLLIVFHHFPHDSSQVPAAYLPNALQSIPMVRIL